MQQLRGQLAAGLVDQLRVERVDRSVYRELPDRRRLIHDGARRQVNRRQLQQQLIATGGRRDGGALEVAASAGWSGRRHGDGARGVHSGGQTERGYDHEDTWRHRFPHRTNGSGTVASLEKGTPSRTRSDGAVTSRRSNIVGIRSTVRMAACGRATLAAIGT